MNSTAFRLAAIAATLTAGAASAQQLPYATATANGNGYGYANPYRQAQVVRCESTNSRPAFCQVDARGQVRLVRQLSRTQCVQGRNWSANERGIRVTDGCRGDFQVTRAYGRGYGNPGEAGYGRDRDDGRYAGRDDGSMRCASANGGRTYCGDAQSRQAMSLRRDPDCIEGRNWGRDQRGTWVSGNCSLQFDRGAYGRDERLRDLGQDDGDYREEGDYRRDDDGYRNDGYGNDGYGNDPYGNDGYGNDDYRNDGSLRFSQVIDCRSRSQGRTYCGDRDRQYVLSGMRSADCRLGETYGRDANGTWVAGNCNAQLGLSPGYDGNR
jgi:hypothetical protein